MYAKRFTWSTRILGQEWIVSHLTHLRSLPQRSQVTFGRRGAAARAGGAALSSSPPLFTSGRDRFAYGDARSILQRRPRAAAAQATAASSLVGALDGDGERR